MTEERPEPRSLILMAACFGLATGVIELVSQACRWFYDPTMRLGDRLPNRHYLWMIPLGEILTFGIIGLALAVVVRVWPRVALRLSVYLLCGLASLKFVLIVPGMHPLTYALLVCGLANLTAPPILAWVRNRRLRARRVLPWLAATVGALAAFSYGRELLAEHRALARLPASSAGAPNVLLIVLDTVRAQDLSLYGNDRDTSPNLVRLARKGVLFERARATAPWTLPSHASMFTGRLPHELGVGAYRPLDTAYPTLAEALAAQGYLTAGFVANLTFCHANYGLARGFVHYEDIQVSLLEVIRSPVLGDRILRIVDFIRYGVSRLVGDAFLVRVFGDDPRSSLENPRRKDATQINRAALDWIRAQRGRPFFVFLNYYDAHDPYIPPLGAERHFGSEPSTPSERAMIRDWINIEKAKPAPSTAKLGRDCYDDCIAYLDGQVGRFINELENMGLLENTVVMIASDHGEHFGEHDGTFGHKRTPYSQETWVPLVVIAPGRAPAGKSVAAPVSLRDLPATVVDLVGLGRESWFPGRSLARIWSQSDGGKAVEANDVLAENEDEELPSSDSNRYWRSLSSEAMVYVRRPGGAEELYNFAADPAEAHNLADTPDAGATLDRLRASLDRILTPGPGRDVRARTSPQDGLKRAIATPAAGAHTGG
jgi:arylsulfatase A-like enzyme